MRTDSGEFRTLLREHLTNLLGGRETPELFWHWFINAWWASESTLDDALWEFCGTIEHLFYVYNDGFFTKGDLYARIAEAAIENGQIDLIPLGSGNPAITSR